MHSTRSKGDAKRKAAGDESDSARAIGGDACGGGERLQKAKIAWMKEVKNFDIPKYGDWERPG